MAIESIEQAVQEIADFYSDAEQKAANIVSGANALKGAWEYLATHAPEGDANNVIGGIESLNRSHRLRALATEFRAELYRFHADDTARAQERGVDLPAPMSGGR